MNARSQELDDQLRRERTLAALKAYVDTRESYNEPLDHDEITHLLGDLLCDLHHLADLEAIDWDETTRSAECVYLAEKAEGQGGL